VVHDLDGSMIDIKVIVKNAIYFSAYNANTLWLENSLPFSNFGLKIPQKNTK